LATKDYDSLVAEMLSAAHYEYKHLVYLQREAAKERMKVQPVQYALQAYAAAVANPTVLTLTQFFVESTNWVTDYHTNARYAWEIMHGMGTYDERLLLYVEAKQNL